jgi:hypothetical protein
MDSAAARRVRAEKRRTTTLLRRTKLMRQEEDFSPVSGPDALSLVTRLTRESWSLSDLDVPTYSREATPYRFVSGRLT